MPPLAAVATAAVSAAVSAVAAVAPALPAIGAGVGIYSAVESRRQAAKQFSEQQEFAERQAGEYYQLTAKQMELQTQASQIKTLANLIGQTRQPAAPQIFTLPAAKKYSAIDQINQVIGKMLRG